MDFTQFSNNNFEAKTWINECFRTPEAQKNNEQFAQSLVMKLQLCIQEMNKSLEDTSQQVVQTIPRILREVESMEAEAGVLSGRMRAVQDDVRRVEHDTAAAMQNLLRIDRVKSRVHLVEKAFREIDNWTALTQDIDEVFAGGNAEAMAERLSALQQCLKVLGEKIPDYKDRMDYLERLKDQFVAAISPSVVAAFNSQSADSVSYFAKMFSGLNRRADLELYYGKCLKNKMNSDWTNLLCSERETSAVEVLVGLNDIILSTWNAQLKWSEAAGLTSSEVEGAGEAVVCAALTLAVGQLNPPVESALSDRITATAADTTTLFVQFRQCCDALVESVESEHCSEIKEALLESIYLPIAPFADNYHNYLQSVLQSKLNAFDFEKKHFSTNARNLEKSVTVIFAEAHKAVDTAACFLGASGLGVLVRALQRFLGNYATATRKTIGSANATERQDEEDEDGTADLPSIDDQQHSLLLTMLAAFGAMFAELEKLESELFALYSRLAAEKDGAVSSIITENQMSSLSRFERLLLKQPKYRSSIEDLLIRITNDNKSSARFLPDIRRQTITSINKAIKMAAKQLMGPVAAILEPVPKFQCWDAATVGESLEADLPTFSLTPQEYITKVGQYLVTLAHHMEPHFSSEENDLCIAFRRGTLPFLSADEKKSGPWTGDQAARLWLTNAGEGAMRRYVDVALRIRRLSAAGARQLATDIEYLCNVVEDLGLSPSDDLRQLRALLLMKETDLTPTALASANFPAPLVSAVKAMRNFK